MFMILDRKGAVIGESRVIEEGLAAMRSIAEACELFKIGDSDESPVRMAYRGKSQNTPFAEQHDNGL